MATPVRHNGCGSLLFWYIGYQKTKDMRSRDVVRLDGTQPKFGSCEAPFYECPRCKATPAAVGMDFRRCFDEDLDPGPVVQATIDAR